MHECLYRTAQILVFLYFICYKSVTKSLSQYLTNKKMFDIIMQDFNLTNL